MNQIKTYMNQIKTYELIAVKRAEITKELEPLNPVMTKACLAGFIGALLTEIGNQKWNEIIEASKLPCATKGCNCHEYGERLYQTLNEYRNTCQDTLAINDIKNL